MKPKLAIDMDEVIAHFLPAFIEFHNTKYNTNFIFTDFSSYKFWDVLKESPKETIQKVYDFHKTEYFKNIKPIQESIEAIQKLQEQYELVIITSRQKEIQNPTEDWIKTYFPNTFSHIYFANHYAFNKETTHSKSEICEQYAIKTIIEDSLEYAQDCAQKGIQVYLLDQPWNQSKIENTHIKRVFHWNEILQKLIQTH